MVNIYFNAGSFDKVTRSAKTNFVSQLSLIGGTFGLFTGFSILSGIEIIYFFIKVDCLFLRGIMLALEKKHNIIIFTGGDHSLGQNDKYEERKETRETG